LLAIARVASAYEYRLHYVPPTTLTVQGLSVIGYEYVGNSVVGDCSYHTTSPCSGRDCHGQTTYYYNTCTWDQYGNFLNSTPGAPASQAPLYTAGTEKVYAVSPDGTGSTGSDARGYGYVATVSPHYSWQTPNGGYADIPDSIYPVRATLVSDGDLAVDFSGAKATPQLYGTYTTSAGKTSISRNTCIGSITPGATCSVTVSYNPIKIGCTGSPYGYAYTGIDLSMVSNSPTTTDFTERFTVTGVPLCDNSD
jgi:hypothetical protein